MIIMVTIMLVGRQAGGQAGMEWHGMALEQ